MKKQSQFLKISILFIMVLILLGCHSAFAGNIQISNNKAKVIVGNNLNHEMNIKVGQEIDLTFIRENGKECLSWFWDWSKETGDGSSVSVIQKHIKAIKAGSVTYKVKNLFANQTATIKINVIEPDLHIYSTDVIGNPVKGDINKDNLITTYDILLLKQGISNGMTYNSDTAHYDVNGDATINNVDVDVLTSHINYHASAPIKNYLYKGKELKIKISEEAYSDGTSNWNAEDIFMYDLEYTATLDGVKFDDLEISIDSSNKKIGNLKIGDNVVLDQAKVLKIDFKVKDDKIDLITNDKKVENVNNSASNSSRSKNASIVIYLEDRVKQANSSWKIFLNDDKQTASISKYIGNESNITIPEVIRFGVIDYPITGIKEDAFEGSSVQTVTFKSNIQNVEEGAFSGASLLKEIKVENNNKYASDAGVLYKTGSTSATYEGIIKYPEGKTDTTYVMKDVEEGLKTFIAKEAFSNTKLQAITIPENLNEIREAAFKNSSNLKTLKNTCTDTVGAAESANKSLNLPNKLTFIGKEAFYGCSNLETLVIPTVAGQIIGKKLDKDYDEIGKVIGDIKVNYVEVLKYQKELQDLNVFKETNCPIQFYSNNKAMTFYADANTNIELFENGTLVGTKTEANFVIVGNKQSSGGDIGGNDGEYRLLTPNAEGKYEVYPWAVKDDKYLIRMNVGEQIVLDYRRTETWDGITDGELIGKNWHVIIPKIADYDDPRGFVEMKKNTDGVYNILASIGTTEETRIVRIGNATAPDKTPAVWFEVKIIVEKKPYTVAIKEGDTLSYEVQPTKAVATIYEGIKDEYKTKDENGNLIDDTLRLKLNSQSGVEQLTNVSWSISGVTLGGSPAENKYVEIDQTGLLKLKPIDNNVLTTLLYDTSKSLIVHIVASYNGENYLFDLRIKPRTIIRGGDYRFYIINSQDAEFIEYTNYSVSEIIIPEKITDSAQKQYNVTNIREGAIHDNNTVTSIAIQQGTIKELNKGIIKNCGSVTKITIPSNIEKIDPQFAINCPALKEVIVEPNNANYKSVDGVVYSKDGKTLVLYPVNKDGDKFTVPTDVVEIDEYAFYGNKKLTQIDLPSGLEVIDVYAFANMNSINNILVPPNVKDLGGMTDEMIDELSKEGTEQTTIVQKMKEYYELGQIGHVFSSATKYKVYYDNENSVAREYGYFFGNINKDGETKPDYIKAITNNVEEADFVKLTVVSIKLIGDKTITGNYYVGESIEEEKYSDLKIQIFYEGVENQPIVNVSKDMLYYKDAEEKLKTFTEFTKEMISSECEIYVDYNGQSALIGKVSVETGKLEVTASEELAHRYLQGNEENPNAYIDEEKVKEQLTVYKLTSKYDETKTEEDGTNSEKIKLTNEEYTVTVGEDKLIITCPANAASAEVAVTTYAENEVEKFENLSDEDYEELKELLKDNIVYFDDETKSIVIPKEDIQNKDIPQLTVKLTKNPDKKFYINGKAGDETVSLAGAEIEILLPMTSDRGDINDDGYVDATDASLISRFISESTNITFTKEQAKNADVNDDGEINEKDVAIIAEHDANKIELPRILKVISVKDSKSITIPETNINKLLEAQTEDKSADIKEQTKLTLKPNYNGIELSEFNIIVEPAEIESIYVAETFAKKEYLDGEKFQKAGFKLMANYAGEIEDAEIKEGYVFKIAEDIIEDNITEIKPENGSKTAKYTVTVEYLGNTANVCDIEVKETILKDVQITIPNKNFVEGQEPIKNGMTVTLTYVNKAGEETKKTLTKAEEILEIFKIEPEKLKVADTKITVTYKNNTDLKQEIDGIKVAAKAITKVELNAWDNMPEQYVGKVNWEGASLKVTYNDGEVKDVLVKEGLASKKLVVNGIEEGKEGTFNVTAVYEGVNATGKWTMNFAEEISKLEIVNLPKTEYLKDSYIDLNGGVLKVTYAREGVAAEEISMADEKVTLEGGNIADSAKTLTVKYKNKTADFDITLIDTGLIEFTGLEITQEPTKTEYKVEEFVTADLSNGKVKISYNYLESDIVLSDILDMANSEFIEIDESAITDNTKLGEYDIKVKAKDNNLLEDTFKVYIKDRIVTEINAVGTGLKGQTYYEGQTLDKNKITVLVTYDDDTTEPITGAKNIDEKFVIEPEVLTKDTKELIVKYKENQEIASKISLTDKIKIVGIKQIIVQPEPIRKTYLVGEDLDVTGGKLHVEYDDGKQEDLDLTDSKITIAGFNSKKPGESIVTVGYANLKALFKVNVITKTYVYEISVKDYQTEYDINDSFNRESGIVEVKHNVDQVFEVPFTSKYVEITEPDLTTEGTKEVTVKYAGKEAKYTVNVTDNNIGSISVKTVPTDMKYLENTEINLDGMVVVLKSKGGRELKELTKEEYIVQFPEKLTKENKDSIVIKYKEDGTFETKLEGIEVYTKEEVQEFNLTKEEFDKVKQEIADKLVNAEEVDGKMQIALIPGKITIKVEKPANDAEYVVGGELETSRYKVVIYYGEGEQPVELTKVALEDSMVTADGKPYVFAESTSGQEVEITAKYLDAEAKFKVKVADSTVVSIAIEGEPIKTKYLENEEFNFDGIKVVGKNKDGVTVKTLTSDEFTIEPTKLLKGLDRTITIKAKENSSWVAQIRGINVYGQDEVKEFTIPVGDYNAIKDSIKDVVITKEELADGNIKVQLVPGKVSIEVRAIYDKEYKVGDTLDLSNYKVIVNYGEGDSKLKITEITLAESMLKAGATFTKEQAGKEVNIKVEYLGIETSFKVNVEKVEVEISISVGNLETQTVENVTYLRIEDGEMTVAELKQVIEDANKELELEIEVLDANGSVVADTEIFATGMTIRISSDTEEKEFVLVKVGYTNSDNKLTISDLIKLLIHLAEENADNPNTEKLLKGAYWVAADITGDGKVNMFDIIPLVNLINNL